MEYIRNFALLFAGYLLLLILSLLFGIATEKIYIIKVIDANIYALIRKIPETKLLEFIVWPFDNNFLPLFKPHPSFLVVMYATFLIYLAIFKRRLFIWAVLALIIATILARIILHIDTQIFFRERPYTALPNDVPEEVKNSLKTWTSYPSGHTRDTAIYATIIAFFIPKLKYFLAAFIVFVGFSRLYLGIHYFSDVVAGALIGVSIGYLTILIIRQISKRFSNDPIV